MNFITIDFETATAKRHSPCELGLTFVKRGKIVETKSWLIRPINNEFSPFNIYIHGICPSHVESASEFNILWNEVKPLIEGQRLIAHNAAFDFSVLRRTLELYEIPFPKLKYLCSYLFSKRIWKGLPAYDLKTLCRLNDIDFNHHRAGDDSRATAELCLKAFGIVNASSINDLAKKLNMRMGQIYEHGYYPCRYRAPSNFDTVEIGNIRNIVDELKTDADINKHNPDSIFYGKTVVFTGILSSMPRVEAWRVITDIGGVINDIVTKKTDFLIIGQQDYRVVGDDGMSTKQKKAIKYIKDGSAMEIMSEYDFINNI
ncbi:MAG: hypothetical protein LBL13_11965 [Bacteroidales bacterium]|jgi:DNA polymerase-3 subunit epsilon|nr:hypothetical protein [Bacteroidales bacterium]